MMCGRASASLLPGERETGGPLAVQRLFAVSVVSPFSTCCLDQAVAKMVGRWSNGLGVLSKNASACSLFLYAVTRDLFSGSARQSGSGSEALAVQGFSHALQDSVKDSLQKFDQKFRCDLASNSFVSSCILAMLLAAFLHAPFGRALELSTSRRRSAIEIESQSPNKTYTAGKDLVAFQVDLLSFVFCSLAVVSSYLSHLGHLISTLLSNDSFLSRRVLFHSLPVFVTTQHPDTLNADFREC
jgi:hypothetical protein